MPTLKFTIGDAFPADEAVARFITVLAMMSNDWMRLTSTFFAIEDWHIDAEGLRIMWFRQQVALHHEAAEFIRDTRKRFPDVDAFINDLEQEAQDECDRVLAGVDPKSPLYHGNWLGEHRNLTFHYPEMHPDKAAHGKEEITEGLKEAAAIESTISMDDNFGSVRFNFADEVVVQWVPEEDQEVMFTRMSDAVQDLARFVQRAAQAYLDSRPSGTFSVE